MKWIALILLGWIVSTCYAEVLVQENFEGTTFPPAGWTTSSGGYGPGSGGWSCQGIISNHYAEGWVESYSSVGWYSAFLNTPDFFLNTGDILTLRFHAMNLGGEWPTLDVYLNGSSQVTYFVLYINKPRQIIYTFSPVTSSGNHSISWRVMASLQDSTCGYDMDNIVISRNMSGNQAQVQPSSLGRIKSAYK